MNIIPAIDIIDGKVVRLEKGDFSAMKIYNNSVLDQAQIFEDSGFSRIHIVDLLGSKNGNSNILKTIESIKYKTGLSIQCGGGVRSFESAGQYFSAGIDQLVIGSLAVKNFSDLKLISQKNGSEKIIIAADVLDKRIMVKGWTEGSEIFLDEHIKNCSELNILEYLITDISRDGMLTGPNVDLYSEIKSKFSAIKIIASGGIGKTADLEELKFNKIESAVVGRAIYEKKIKLEELKKIAG